MIAAVIVPDSVTVSFALSLARDHGGILQTNGRCNCIAPKLLPGYGRILGGGERCVIIGEVNLAPGPEAA